MSLDVSPSLTAPSEALLDRLAGIVGPQHAIRDPADHARYLVEWRDRYTGLTPLVLRPGTTREVADIVALCTEARVGIVPQGGNTGLVGGQIPSKAGHEIVLSLERLTRIRHIDPAGTSMTVEAGMTLAAAKRAAAEHGRSFPLSMASEGSCTIGGNLATNAGGVQVLAYGNARNLALGIEAVLAGGRIWNGLRALKKDNTGYDLKDLLIGSEGTLGIITAATLSLFPEPQERATAFVALDDLDALLALFRLAQDRCGTMLTGFEFMSDRALAFVLRHGRGARAPFSAPHAWYALVEISSGEEQGASPLLERLLAEALEHATVSAAVVAGSLAQSRELWRLREGVSEAQKCEGGSIKHDVSVPVTAIPEFLARAARLVEQLCPGARPVPFGHFGDGNVHYNISQPEGADRTRFLALWGDMSRAVHDLVTELGGSISAEHGIGQMKREELRRLKSTTELDLMRSIKRALDPAGILNPGKVL